MSEKQIKKPTLISLIIGLILFISLFSIPYIIELTKGISDPYYNYVKSFLIAFPCFAFSIIAIFYIPMFTWLRIKKNRSRPKWVFFFCSFFIVILIVSVGFSFPFVIWQENQETREDGEIVILNNRDFNLKYGFPGKGSESDPYLIEDLQINTTKTYGILIRKTNKFFVIRNCSIQANNSPLAVYHVASGTGKISGNRFVGGVIQFRSSDAIFIEGNTVYGGILITNSNFGNITNNFCEYLRVSFCNQVSINNNRCTNDLMVSSSEFSTISNNIISNSDFSGIWIYGSNNLIVVNNFCFNNPIGIKVEYSELVSLYGNNCSLNFDYGVEIQYSGNISLANNLIQENKNGILLLNNQYVVITNNQISNNTEYGLFVQFAWHQNLIFQNNFYFNNIAGTPTGIAQVFDNTSLLSLAFPDVYWYNSNTNVGNYWSDLIWNEGVIYEIDGGNSTDPYPLEHPVSI
ncbi:MAG: hypothetical protein GPJ52_09285 [Candidatus Heimdallarchaeota archaeon]|nr:hypothetical protein [Candidatus Heimdallarchaeota archaeon]